MFQPTAFSLAVCLLVTLGCTGNARAPVQGTVTLPDGSPAVGVMVSFSDSATRNGAFGQADERGVYQLTTDNPNDGAAPGTYDVTVTQPGPQDSSEADPPRLFPKRFENPETSKLKFTVKPGKNVFDIKLDAE